MVRIFALAVALLWSPGTASAADRVEVGNLVLEGIPEIPDELTERLRQYQNARGAFLQGWHPSGEGLLISTRFGETNQVHWVKMPGGARHQLTFFDEPVGSVAVSPDPELNGFVYSRDVGGSESFQLFFFDLAGGASRLLTDGSSRNGGVTLSNGGDRMAFYTTKRNGTDWDIHLAGLAGSGDDRVLLAEGGSWVPGEWSPDDSKLLLTRLVSANESFPYVLDLASGELRSIRPDTGEQIAYGGATWAHDGRGVYYSSDESSEFRRLRYYDLATGESEALTGDIPWNVDQIALSADGLWLAFVVNQGGLGKLHLWKMEGDPGHAGRRSAPLPDMPAGQVFGLEFSPDSKRLAMGLATFQTPADVFVLELASGRLERWTYSEVGGLDSSKFVSPELVEYETFDKVDGEPRKIPAFYYRPTRYDGKPFPVVIDIHGGPEGQHQPSFNPQSQYLVYELGIAVVAPNVRGSSGYGKSYLKLDNGFLREDSVKDIGALLDWIAARPELDADRVALIGGSYGGYMVLAAMTHYNDRLRGAVDVVGISNFVTFLENTRDYRRDLRRVEYGDERDPEMRAFLEKISPVTNAGKITRPLFIAQGLNDPRVPVSEAEQILATVRANGGSPWYFLAKDEGHGFRKKSNRDHFNSAMSLFLERVLLSEDAEDGPTGSPD